MNWAVTAMQIRLAETAGFCFGVERAVALAEQTARSCKNAVTLGPIIHNRHVVARFELLGLREISAADEAQPGQTVVIRAHGIPVGEQRMLSARGALTVDATCPFVKKIHVIAQKAERDGRSLLIIGTPTHPEVIAIASYSSDAHVFQTRRSARNLAHGAPGAARFAVLSGFTDDRDAKIVGIMPGNCKKSVYKLRNI